MLLLVNDHVFKGSGWIAANLTGKLSDFAGLLAAPAALAVALRLRTRRAVFVLHFGIGGLFVTLKILPPAAALWEEIGAWFGLSWQMWCDPTDLVALPMLLLSWRYIIAAQSSASQRAWHLFVQASGAIIGVLSCLATSYPRPQAPARAPTPALTPSAVVWYDYTAHRVHVFDRKTGFRRFSTSSDVDPVVLNESVVVYSEYAVRAYDLRKPGRTLWSYQPRDKPRMWPCEGDLLASTNSNTVVLDAATGTARVMIETASKMADCVAGLVLVMEKTVGGANSTGYRHALVAYDGHTGKERWRHTQEEGIQGALGVLVLSQFWHTGDLHAIDPMTGKEVWRRHFSDIFLRPFVVEQDIAILPVPDCCTIALDVEGRELWNRPSGELIGNGGGRVFFSENGEIVAVDVRNGGTVALVSPRGPG